MKDQEYKRDGDKILRVKDDKHLATVEDGKIKPTAPAYYRIKEKLEEFAFGPELPSMEGLSPVVEESLKKAGEDHLIRPASSPAKQLEEVWDKYQSWEQVAEFAKSLFTVAPIVNQAGGLQKPVPLPSETFDLTGLPKSGPLGSRNPVVVEWWVENYPEEARKRYEGKGNETYNNLTK